MKGFVMNDSKSFISETCLDLFNENNIQMCRNGTLLIKLDDYVPCTKKVGHEYTTVSAVQDPERNDGLDAGVCIANEICTACYFQVLNKDCDLKTCTKIFKDLNFTTDNCPQQIMGQVEVQQNLDHLELNDTF